MAKHDNRMPIQTALGYVEEARAASRDWRAKSWRDHEMYDGDQWTSEDRQRAVDAGIDPLTINRIFPAINLILGSQELNRANIIAKARTAKDGQIAEIMTEALAFVLDQNDGQYRIGQAFKDAVIPGIGWLYCGFNNDPRQERIKLDFRDWKEVFWDPFASPWLESDKCRYAFFQRWMDLFDLQCLYPERKKEIGEAFSGLSAHDSDYSYMDDEADIVEQDKRVLGSTRWSDPERRRIRPVQLWYPVLEKAVFALFPDGQCVEVNTKLPDAQVYMLVRNAQQLITTSVRKLRVKTFIGSYELSDEPSPFPHGQYPFIPFIGYLDRYLNPFGVPRMLSGQNEEINKRRSMNLAMLQKRRIIVEEGAADDLQNLYEEANKPDGFMVLNPGGRSKMEIIEGAQLSQYQIQVLEQSEKEIQQISGANDEAMGYTSNANSGKAIELRRQQSSTIMASLFGNYRRSMSRLGQLVIANVQGAWTAEKVLRITDKMTNAERFVTVNQKVLGESGDVVEIHNDITQGMYDVIVSDAPATDSVREQNMNLLIEWCKQSPPEVIPYLMGMAMEMSNLPNKDQLMMKLKPMMGITPEEMDMSPEELQQRAQQEAEAKAQAEQMQQQAQQQLMQAGLEKAGLENELLRAQIDKTRSEAGMKAREQDRKEFQTGIEAGNAIRQARNEDAAVASLMPPAPLPVSNPQPPMPYGQTY